MCVFALHRDTPNPGCHAKLWTKRRTVRRGPRGRPEDSSTGDLWPALLQHWQLVTTMRFFGCWLLGTLTNPGHHWPFMSVWGKRWWSQHWQQREESFFVLNPWMSFHRSLCCVHFRDLLNSRKTPKAKQAAWMKPRPYQKALHSVSPRCSIGSYQG